MHVNTNVTRSDSCEMTRFVLLEICVNLVCHGVVAELSNYYLFLSCDWEMYKLSRQENSDV